MHLAKPKRGLKILKIALLPLQQLTPLVTEVMQSAINTAASLCEVDVIVLNAREGLFEVHSNLPLALYIEKCLTIV